MGVVSALFVILLSASGLILHQGQFLGLGSSFVNSPGMLAWYGIEVPRLTLSFASGSHRASLIADAIYFDTDRLPGSYSFLAGLVPTEFGYALATDDQILLLTQEGELIEVLGAVHGSPRGIESIGRDDSQGKPLIYLRSNAAVVQADLNALTWTDSAAPESQIQWASSSSATSALIETIRKDYGGSLLSWERLVLDVHSGRFLGGLGVVLVDIMAILFLLMAITGVWIWSRRRS